jgi:hypothetical protein
MKFPFMSGGGLGLGGGMIGPLRESLWAKTSNPYVETFRGWLEALAAFRRTHPAFGCGH